MKKNYNTPNATVTSLSAKDVITLSAISLGIAPEYDFESIFNISSQGMF